MLDCLREFLDAGISNLRIPHSNDSFCNLVHLIENLMCMTPPSEMLLQPRRPRSSSSRLSGKLYAISNTAWSVTAGNRVEHMLTVVLVRRLRSVEGGLQSSSKNRQRECLLVECLGVLLAIVSRRAFAD